jgi:GntR family transcriptional repressor for pyruvate dehydrogenase complex
MNSKPLTSTDPISRATLSEQVAKQLAARIMNGEWKPGEKLPSETELSKIFNVGRSSLREALTSLSFIGLIRIRAGGGSYIADQPSAYLTNAWLNSGKLADERTLREFLEARMILETEVVGLCAEKATAEELDEMQELVDKMWSALRDHDQFSKLDLSFHLCLGKAAKNEVLNNILIGIREQSMELITKSLLLDEGLEIALRGHIKIMEALRQHHVAKAREAMHIHLQLFQRGYHVLLESKQSQD